MAKVTGIGGVFFKSAGDHKALAAWYHEHLGMPLEAWGGAVLKWPEDRAEDEGGDDSAPPPPIQTMGEGELIFHESFDTKYLNNFLRSMNRTTVMLNMAPGQPLHVMLPLGGRDSSVTFILAPKQGGD